MIIIITLKDLRFNAKFLKKMLLFIFKNDEIHLFYKSYGSLGFMAYQPLLVI